MNYNIKIEIDILDYKQYSPITKIHLIVHINLRTKFVLIIDIFHLKIYMYAHKQ